MLAFAPMALFAAQGAETDYDIIQRTVNFVIFVSILWYLLADKAKAYFAQRSMGIQAELDKVQDTLKASQAKVDEATKKLENAKKLAVEIVNSANAEVDTIAQKVSKNADSEIANLSKNFDEKIKIETRKAKKEVVESVLNELLSSENIGVSQDELANIVLKKVA
jgi:F-type H+-transporting ATPase subunit b